MAVKSKLFLVKKLKFLKLKNFSLDCHTYLMPHVTYYVSASLQLSPLYALFPSFLLPSTVALCCSVSHNIQLKYSPFYIKITAEKTLISICARGAEMQKFLHTGCAEETVRRC